MAMDMRLMFYMATKFNSNISNWDIISSQNMSYMFGNAKLFNRNINTKQVTVNGIKYTAWDTSLKYMGYMFKEASSFNVDISNWDTEFN